MHELRGPAYIMKVLYKENDQNSPVGCNKLLLEINRQKKMDFAGFSSCVQLVLFKNGILKK
jgi:hypothetical protein